MLRRPTPTSSCNQPPTTLIFISNPTSATVFAVVYLVIVLVLLVGAMVRVVPHLGTAGAVGVIVGCVALLGFAIWIVARGGGWGGWGNSGRMGN